MSSPKYLYFRNDNLRFVKEVLLCWSYIRTFILNKTIKLAVFQLFISIPTSMFIRFFLAPQRTTICCQSSNYLELWYCFLFIQIVSDLYRLQGRVGMVCLIYHLNLKFNVYNPKIVLS